jgi:hypothetical protein
MECTVHIIEDIIIAIEKHKSTKPSYGDSEQDKDMHSGKLIALEDCLQSALHRFRSFYHQDYMKIRADIQKKFNFK